MVRVLKTQSVQSIGYILYFCQVFQIKFIQLSCKHLILLTLQHSFLDFNQPLMQPVRLQTYVIRRISHF